MKIRISFLILIIGILSSCEKNTDLLSYNEEQNVEDIMFQHEHDGDNDSIKGKEPQKPLPPLHPEDPSEPGIGDSGFGNENRFNHYYNGTVLMTTSQNIMGTFDTGNSSIDDKNVDDLGQMMMLGTRYHFTNGVVIFSQPMFGDPQIPKGSITLMLKDKVPTKYHSGNNYIMAYHRYYITLNFKAENSMILPGIIIE